MATKLINYVTTTCDRCGHSTDTNAALWGSMEAGTSIIQIGGGCKGYELETVDLCPDCCRSLEQWWNAGREPKQ